MRIQSLSFPDRLYHRACLLPIEEELKKRGHDVIQAFEPLPKEKVDATLISTYDYLKNGAYKILKRPIFFSEHGVSVVKSGFRKKDHILADYMLQTGPIWLERTKSVAPGFKGNLAVGFPKSDQLVHLKPRTKDIRNEVIKEFALDPNEPIILFAPTWYNPGAGNPGSSVALEQIEKAAFKNLLIAFHDYDVFRKKYSAKPYLKDANKNRYLLAADLLIGDYSSIVIEFAILNKPIVQVNAFEDQTYFNLWREDGQGIFRIGEIVKPENIYKAVKKALSDPKEYESLRKYWVDRCFYNLGNATISAADTIEKIVSSYKPNKRFFFF